MTHLTKSRSAVLLAAAGLVILQVCKTAYIFRGVDLSVPLPLLNVDFAIYYAKTLRIHELLVHSGRGWGYDPYQMAGYPYASSFTSAGFLIEYLAHLLTHFISIERALLCLQFLVMLSFPFLGALALYLWTHDKKIAAAGFIAYLLTHAAIEPMSQLFLEKGLFPFQFCGFAMLCQVAFFHRWVRKTSLLNWGLQTLFSTLVPLIHPTGVVVAFFPCAALILSVLHHPPKWFWVQLLISIAIVLAANLVWIEPTLAFWSWVSTTDYLKDFGLNKFFGFYGFTGPTLSLRFFSFVNVFVLICTALCLNRFRKESWLRAGFFSGWLLTFLLIIAFGNALGLRSIHPYRYIMPFWIVAYGLTAVEMSQWTAMKAPRFAVAFIVILTTGFIVRAAVVEKSIYPKLSNRWPDFQRQFIEYVKKSKDPSGRLLMECRELGYPHFMEYLAFATQQPLLGGPFGSNYLITKFTLFVTGAEPVIFERFLRDFSERDFEKYLTLYNVHRIAVTSAKAAGYLAQFKDVLSEENPTAGHRIFTVRKPSNWFEKGSGEVSVEMDRIEIQNASKGELILKYHWLPIFRTEPSVATSPVYLMDDPAPFIRVDNTAGYKRIVISNKGLN